MSHGGGNRRGGGRRSGGDNFHRGPKEPQADKRTDEVDESSEVIQSFRQFSKQLDTKHDKYERLVKLSRDVTIESKRIIFQIHTIGSDEKKEEILAQAENRLKQVETSLLKSIAKELQGEDTFQFLRSFSPGIQEYIEAKTFWFYMKHKTIPTWTMVQEDLTFPPEAVEGGAEASPDFYGTTIQTPLVPTEFVLGVADLTGELMRQCINCVGMGQLDTCRELCSFMRLVYQGFMGINCPGYREMGRKIYTLRQSLMKTENVCYTIHVRGKEVPKHLLKDVLSMAPENPEEDEGYY